MKKTILSVAMVMSAIALIAAPAGPAATQKQTPELKNTSDSTAYAIGILWAKALDNVGASYEVKIDTELVTQTMKDHIAGRTTMTYQEAEEWLNNYWYHRLPAIKQAKYDAVADSLKAANPNIKQTESGLLYEIFAEGSEPHAKYYDKLVMRYTKTLLDGTPVKRSNGQDSQNDADSVSMTVYNLIAGSREGVQLIGKGGHIKLWLNPSLARGAEYGDASSNEFLVFDFEILDIVSDDESDYFGERKYDDNDNLIQYPDEEDGYVWKRTKKSNTRKDDQGNTWKRVKVKE